MSLAVRQTDSPEDPTMDRNRPLTSILQGHKIVAAKRGKGCITLAISGGYDIIVVTSARLPEPLNPTGRIAEAWHAEKMLRLDMEDGSSLSFHTLAPEYCVLVRSDAHGIEYAR